MGMGARALGMGGRVSGVAMTASDIHNPAGLAFWKANNITSFNSNAFGAGNYMGVGYARPNIGAALFRTVSTVQGTDGGAIPQGPSGQEGAIELAAPKPFGPALSAAAQGIRADVPEQLRLRRNRRYRGNGKPAGRTDSSSGSRPQWAGSVKFESGHKDP